MKKTILAVSFGTSYEDAVQSSIVPVEQAIARAFPEWEVRRAFTSRIIACRWKERGVDIPGEEEALKTLRAEGAERIVVASTHIIPGEEYDRVKAAARGLPVSAPLLNSAEDMRRMAALLQGIAAQEGTPLLVMGHGTAHSADAVYEALRTFLPENVFLACVDGRHTLDGVLPRLKKEGVRTVTAMPLMLVAGDHARNDLAGDAPGSWKNRLEAQGISVRTRLCGLGSLAEIQNRFVEKVAAAMEE